MASFEIRKVPRNWKHPKDAAKNSVPLFVNYRKRLEAWILGEQMWSRGKRIEFSQGQGIWIDLTVEQKGLTYGQWTGERPEPKKYMPEFADQECDSFCVYETVTPGTPVTPVLKSIRACLDWLVENGVYFAGSSKQRRESWAAALQSSAVGIADPNGWAEMARRTVANVRGLTQEVELLKEKLFPNLSAVKVQNSRFNGCGIVWRSDDPPLTLSVKLENGNVWQYPIDDCIPLPKDLWPEWIRREVRLASRRRAQKENEILASPRT